MEIHSENTEVIEKKDGSVVYRYRLFQTDAFTLSVKQLKGPDDVKCCANLALYANNTTSAFSHVVFGFPNPLRINQTEEELIANCPCIPHNFGDYVLDILFFKDAERKGLNIGKDWCIQVNITQPEPTKDVPVPLWRDDLHT